MSTPEMTLESTLGVELEANQRYHWKYEGEGGGDIEYHNNYNIHNDQLTVVQ